MDKGYVHIYTGNGKGKSTAAFGLAIRSACAGNSVYIGQFVKDMAYSEVQVTQYIPKITVETLGLGCFIENTPSDKDLKAAEEALEKCASILKGEDYQLVILDEINIALYFNLLNPQKVIEVLENRNPSIEVVLTGRYASQDLIDYADLVTEMKEIKHYYEQGVLSRKGIDC